MSRQGYYRTLTHRDWFLSARDTRHVLQARRARLAVGPARPATIASVSCSMLSSVIGAGPGPLGPPVWAWGSDLEANWLDVRDVASRDLCWPESSYG